VRILKLVPAAFVLAAAGCLPAVPGPGNGAVKSFSVAQCAGRAAPDHGTGCMTPLRNAIEALRPGETLKIQPGTYDIDAMRIDVKGTETNRVTVMAADPQRRPLLRGMTLMRGANYVTLLNLRFRAAVDHRPAVAFQCGVGWALVGSDASGASATGAFSNLNIDGTQPGGPSRDDGNECPDEPRDFRVHGNAFFDPYTDPNLEGTGSGSYHNIYCNFEGTARTSGIIDRNLFVGMANGAGIKLGNSEENGGLGPWNVRVLSNTFVNGRSAIVVYGDVRRNEITGNLVAHMRGGPADTNGVAVKVNTVPSPSNTIDHTYGFDVTSIWESEHEDGSTLDAGPDNRVRGNPDFDPNFDDPTGVDGLKPRAPAAQPYGRYGTGKY
jgi:hypothetical protein